MVFLIRTLSEIEQERQIYTDLIKKFKYTQYTTNIIDEPELSRFIENILEEYLSTVKNGRYCWSKETLGIQGVFADAIFNAGERGNQNQIGKKIKVTIKYGFLGSIIIIEDEGEGFEFQKQIQAIEQQRKHIFSRNGGGMRKFHNSNLEVSYHEKGNIISISTPAYQLNEDDTFSRKNKE